MHRFAHPSEPRQLKDALTDAGLSYAELARELGVSRRAVGRLVQEGQWPRYQPKEVLRAAIEKLLAARSVNTKDLWPTTQVSGDEDPDEEVRMRVRLSEAARQLYALPDDPWAVRRREDVWVSGRWRQAADMVTVAAETGAFAAVIGESGAGKTTLRRYVEDRLAAERRPVRWVAPLALDRSRITASSLCEAVIADLSQESPRSSLEWRTRQVRRILAEAHQAGTAAVIVIDDAHDLHPSTLRFSRRLWELGQVGFAHTASVVLLGQPPLRERLATWEQREVASRLEVCEIGALDEAEITGYLRHRIGEELFDEGVPAAIKARLSPRARVAPMTWPIAVASVMTGALNFAAELGLPRVTPEAVSHAQ